MKYKIQAYGQPVLREETKEIEKNHPGLDDIIANMYETMYSASGVGLAGPQVGLSLRIFVIDGEALEGALEDDPTPMKGFKKVFINPVILEEEGEEWAFNEGCLSIPDVRADVFRPETVTIEYYDKEFNKKTDSFSGLQARIIQHEYDHLEGILFTDYLSGLKKQLIKGRLAKISQGKIDPPYEMEYPKIKRAKK